jgi:hypothetical protein
MTDRPGLYLGCGTELGHHLFLPGKRPSPLIGYPHLRDFASFETVFQPQPESGDLLYVAAYFRLDGWGYCGLAWWDRTVDTREKSNSALFCPALLAEPISIVRWAQEQFPWVLARLPRPLTLWMPPR